MCLNFTGVPLRSSGLDYFSSSLHHKKYILKKQMYTRFHCGAHVVGIQSMPAEL